MLMVMVTTTTEGGTYSIDSSGVWSYRPNQGVSGQDSFIVVSTDTQGGKSEQKITVNIVEGIYIGEKPFEYLIIDYDLYIDLNL